MTALALGMTCILVVLAAVHVTWALGVWWPFGNEARLTRAVVGTRGADRMPGPIPLALVAVFLVFAAAWPWLYWQGRAPLGGWGVRFFGIVFLVRGVLAYVPVWQRMTPQQPYRQNDRRYFGPFCIGIASVLFLISGG